MSINLKPEIYASIILAPHLETISADTCRNVKNLETSKADTFRKTGKSETLQADSYRKICKTENNSADTFRRIGQTEKISADTERNLLEFISADTYRKVVKVEKIVADTSKRIPHKLIYAIDTPLMKRAKLKDLPPLLNTFKDYGLTALNITLQEKTLSDTFQLETVQGLEINDAVAGKFLDYEFNFLVEETSKQDLIQSVKGMYDQDILLYSKFRIGEKIILKWKDKSNHKKTYEFIQFSNAASYLWAMADAMGLAGNFKFDDFVPYNMESSINSTYISVLSNLFGWSSRVPQRQINVFIRGGVLNCIQRGMEESVFDISDLPHTRPIVNKKLLRTMWNRSELDDEDDEATDEEIDISEPFTGTIQFTTTNSDGDSVYSSLRYVVGYLVEEETSTSGDKGKSESKSFYTYETYHSKYTSGNTINATIKWQGAGTYYLRTCLKTKKIC